MKKILLIEDDAFLVDIYTTKLKEVGFEVLVAFDGEEGFKKAKEEKPDLVLLDLVLPGMDGWEFLKKVKNENLSNLKIVILSNLGNKEEVEKGMSLGVAKYLVKSHYAPSEVIDEVKKILM
jgi:DNA-binding response OmpR family regulator